MHTFKKISTASSLIVVGLVLSSCEFIGPKQVAKLPLTPVTDKGIEEKPIFKELQNKPPVVEKGHPKSELIPGSNGFVPGSIVDSSIKKSKVKGTYNLNFDEADLGEVAKLVLGDILGLNYVVNPKATGKVTLQTSDPLTKEELLPTLEMVLRMNNAALVKDAKVYHIEPANEAVFNSTLSPTKPGLQTRIIPVKNISVKEISEVMKPLLHDKTILSMDEVRNILVVSGSGEELDRVTDMVATFDVDSLKGRSFGLFPISHAEPDKLIQELQEVFGDKGKESDFTRFVVIERLNAILAITHQANILKEIEDWVFRLDKANVAAGGGVNVYKVQHVDAVELAGTLNEIFTGAAKKEKSAKVAPGQQAATISNKQSTDKPKPKPASASRGGGGSGDVNITNISNVRIIADEANNSLIIVSTPQEYQVILPVINQLDILPLQVLIDATIVSVELKDDLKYGIAWYFDRNNSNVGSGLNATSLGSVVSAGAAAFATGGLSAVYNSGAINALLTAQAAKDNVNVISSPSLMVLNNQQAKIEVGTQIPIQTGGYTAPTGGIGTGTGGIGTGTGTGTGNNNGLITNTAIQYKDTGVMLEVTPRVNANGMVIMKIKQIVSSPVASTIGVTTSAAIAKTEVNSNIAIQDGETLVLGGLVREQGTYNKAGIPWIHELPLIGPLFGNTQNDKDRNELVVLITPRVVKTRFDARLISDEFKRKLTGIYKPVSVSSNPDVKVLPRK